MKLWTEASDQLFIDLPRIPRPVAVAFWVIMVKDDLQKKKGGENRNRFSIVGVGIAVCQDL